MLNNSDKLSRNLACNNVRAILPRFNRKTNERAGLAKVNWKEGRCYWTGHGRNELIVVNVKRDGKKHGTAVNQTVAMIAYGAGAATAGPWWQ